VERRIHMPSVRKGTTIPVDWEQLMSINEILEKAREVAYGPQVGYQDRADELYDAMNVYDNQWGTGRVG
jgi:hypothetical protein